MQTEACRSRPPRYRCTNAVGICWYLPAKRGQREKDAKRIQTQRVEKSLETEDAKLTYDMLTDGSRHNTTPPIEELALSNPHQNHHVPVCPLTQHSVKNAFVRVCIFRFHGF